ncbi:MAG TPA: hypothetical protein VLZ83_07335 [Edaphocola sp.]|nr:hypothetical protein [Edaphocola sp.]
MERIIKYLLLLIFLGFSFLNTNAQDYHIGLKVGADIYKNLGNTVVEEYHTYPYGGAYLGISGEKLGLYVEGIFSQTTMVAGDNFNQIYKGYIATGKQSIQNPKFSFAEISVPILISYKLFNPVWAEGGLQFTKIVNMTDKENVLKEIQNIYKDSYISGVLGLRIFLTRKIQLHGRYIYGFSDRNNSSINEKWTTQHFQAGLSYGL